jgi:hypothetical protein
MKKIKFYLVEILKLESEINGFTNPHNKEVIYKGFVNHNLPILLKYELTDLSDFLRTEKKKIEGLRDELIKKFGKEDNEGNVTIQTYVNAEDGDYRITEEFMNFEKEYNLLLSQEIEVNCPEITKEDLKKAGESTDNYELLFKLIKKEETSI